MKISFSAAVGCLLLLPFISLAQESPSGKWSLFNPVPAHSLGEMYTDRPGVTETPFVVGAGHLQVETDLASYSRQTNDEEREVTLLYNNAIVKIGLFSQTDLQIGLESYGRRKVTQLAGGESQTTRGIGDLTLRVKRTLIGSPESTFSLAVLPYVTFPTARYDESDLYEGGLLIPMNFKVSDSWEIGVQVEGDRKRDDDDKGVHTELLQSLSVNHDFASKVQGVFETYYTYDTKQHHWTNYLNAALQLEVAKDVKLDAGLNYGLQHDAQRTCFLGASFRF
ncbi:transporter [Arcticibacter sp. MXS-1]|uniref:transporter n=1 Tax=Arcticibacter sp. MXS-1 TaxID=3341726 RepID=UPI0035A8675D